jgi:hypothetical protein
MPLMIQKGHTAAAVVKNAQITGNYTSHLARFRKRLRPELRGRDRIDDARLGVRDSAWASVMKVIGRDPDQNGCMRRTRVAEDHISDVAGAKKAV